MSFRLLAAPTLALVLAGTLVACGSDDASSGDATSAAATAEGSTGADEALTLNDADIEFAQGMIAHHEQAVEMAEIGLDPTVGAGPEVTDLATRIQAAQEPEIELMTAWLTAAGESVTMDVSDGHDMSSMEGMMSVEQMDALMIATGAEFDQMWLEMMIAHHEGAISQSETVKADGSNPDVLLLADQIIVAQQSEITEMQALLGN
ncbi:MAG TPA: DUF305 domain-containing protein [Ilumatobacteraceae bacterium]|nr:DUF305 domain-containing protein [Ilumatobacteraceae bacterium]